MSVHAIAFVLDGFVNTVSSTYNINCSASVTDGTQVYSVASTSMIPFPVNEAQRNHTIRQDLSAKIYSTTGLTIDPDDIYMPLFFR